MGGAKSFLACCHHRRAHAFIGDISKSDPRNISAAYTRHLQNYGDRAKRVVQGRLGYVRGSICHFYHGKKANRRYVERWVYLRESNFDPDTDLCRGHNGVIRLTGTKPTLALGCSRYFAQRNEDGIDKE